MSDEQLITIAFDGDESWSTRLASENKRVREAN